MSVRSVMACNFHLCDILHVPDRRWRDAAFAKRAIRRYRFIHGHLHSEFVQAIGDHAEIVTFLREPVERVLSLYFFLRNQDPSAHTDRKARFTIEQARRLSLEEFVAHSDRVIASMVGNYQVQMLLDASQSDDPSRTWVASALANLRRYRFVGIADPDLMGDSMTMLSRACGWPETGDTPRVNHTARPVTPNELERAREIIAVRNELDNALYVKVRAELLARLGRHRAGSARDRRVLGAERKRYSTGLTGYVSMHQPLRSWGWHDRELDPARQHCWRCAAQLRAGVELKVQRGRDLLLLFHLRSAHPRISVADTTIEANGRALPSRILLASNRWVIAVVARPQDIGRDGILALEIVCKENDPEVRGSVAPMDSRYVTLALESIEVLGQESRESHIVELLRQVVCEPRITRRQLQEITHALEQERSARQSECTLAERHHAAMLDRAERAETFCESLKVELAKRRTEHQALLAAREAQQRDSERYQAALCQRAERAESYCESLRTELVNRQAENRTLLAAREEQQTEAQNYQATLRGRAERAETYCESLRIELAKREAERQALLTASEHQETAAQNYQATLRERAERAETYCEALKVELQKRQDTYDALAAVRDRENAEASAAQEALLARALRAETSGEALRAELREKQQQDTASSPAIFREPSQR